MNQSVGGTFRGSSRSTGQPGGKLLRGIECARAAARCRERLWAPRHAVRRQGGSRTAPLSAAGIAALSAVLVSGCDLAPVYDPPHLLLPDSYQGTTPFEVARPDAELSSRGDWWVLFGDPELNRLEEELERTNPTLEAAAEAYTQARDLAA